MTRRVFPDAMIQRADLAVESDDRTCRKPEAIIDHLQAGSLIAASLGRQSGNDSEASPTRPLGVRNCRFYSIFKAG